MAENGGSPVYREDAGINYRLMTLADFRNFREMALGEADDWKEHYKDELTRVESKPPGDDSTSLNIIRVRRVMPAVPPQVLYDQLQDADYRATWDDKMIEGYNIVQLDRHNDVGYYSAKFPWPLANRDFCNQRSWMEFTNGEYVIFNHSEPHNKCPVKKNFVRAKSILTGYFMQPWKGGVGTILTYVTHSDPCGAIPHTVLNFVMTKFAPSLLNKCEEYSLAYPDFCSRKYPPGYVFSWRTPKMDWDSKSNFPEDEVKACASAAEDTAAGGAAAVASTGEPAESPAAAADEAAAAAVTKLSGGGDATSQAGGGSGASAVPLLSLAPVAALKANDGLAVQQYRAILQDAMNAVDRSFLREGRAPTTKEYLVRLRYVIEGIRKTTADA